LWLDEHTRKYFADLALFHGERCPFPRCNVPTLPYKCFGGTIF
jgi:hypothetical protein